jgi:hypothetical protein
LRELESRFGFSCNSESVVSQLSSKSWTDYWVPERVY